MLEKLRKYRPRHHVVVAYLALFVALSGTSYAVARNSVGHKQIRTNAVRAPEVRANAIGNSELQDNSVGGAELANGQVGTNDMAANSVDGSKVADGSLGFGDAAPGSFLGGKVTVQFEQAEADLGNGAELSLDVHCPAGQTAIGGGVRGDLTNSELTKVTASRPVVAPDNTGAPADDGTFTGWRGTFVNENNGAGIRPEVWVICTSAP
jgi:hypothetical protein